MCGGPRLQRVENPRARCLLGAPTTADDPLDETDLRVLEFIKSYDFEAYPWSTAEASSQLGIPATRVFQALSKIQRFKKDEVFVYFRDGAIRIQTE